MKEIEMKQLSCSVCGRHVEVILDKVTIKCLSCSPEYWDVSETVSASVPTRIGLNDESNKIFVGRFLLPEEIGPYLALQKKPNWARYFCVHHTWSPDEKQWRGYSSLLGCFSYFHYERGWPEGQGPHFWVAPFYKNGPWGVWIGTHPSRIGIGATDWNYDTLHMETAWNGDVHPFSTEVVNVITRVIQEVSIYAGIPKQIVNFGNSGFAIKGKNGLLFHRDTPKANKSCPGNYNTHENVFYPLFHPQDNLRYGDTGEGVANLQSKLQKVGYRLDITSKFDHRTETLVRSMQASKGLKVTGIADMSMFNISDRELKLSDVGLDVTWIQRILARLKFYPPVIEDVFASRLFDAETGFSISKFQTFNKLPISGIVDKETWSKLRYLSN